MADAPLFRSGAVARVQLHLLRLVRDHPGGTYSDYAKQRNRGSATTGDIMRKWWEAGWIKPDRELPAHWTITPAGEKVLTEHAHLLADE
jgi:hypothetical protein